MPSAVATAKARLGTPEEGAKAKTKGKREKETIAMIATRSIDISTPQERSNSRSSRAKEKKRRYSKETQSSPLSTYHHPSLFVSLASLFTTHHTIYTYSRCPCPLHSGRKTLARITPHLPWRPASRKARRRRKRKR